MSFSVVLFLSRNLHTSIDMCVTYVCMYIDSMVAGLGNNCKQGSSKKYKNSVASGVLDVTNPNLIGLSILPQLKSYKFLGGYL